jgi:hypothetical protein
MINLILKKYWSYLLIALLAVVIYFMFSTIKAKNAEIIRKTSNIEVLNSEFQKYKVESTIKINGKDSTIQLNAAKINSLSYTVAEFEQYRGNDAQTIESLKLKLKNVISVANVETQIEQNITAPTIKTDSSTCFNYKDEFIELSGCTVDTTTDISYKVKDKLLIVPSIVKKHHFLWFEWGVKGIQLDVLSKNPNSSFTYESYIEIKK